ncbi:MAG: 50S ribosomal protein L11 methyltransferase [Verrucomicrobia bacterium]|nr:50S ribosomal protein L11 methyltransferase [Verrucomicrobiota bacterium]
MINWEEQWANFAHRFEDGKAHIPLPDGREIQLLPGPGFGDYSHPTTQLMIALMAEYVPNQTVFDIGCGSGILSVAAAKMGAKNVYACDIDPDALLHTAKNGALNSVEIETTQKPFGNLTILMNMIQSEQEIAWKTNSRPFSRLITSGILISDLDNYMKFARKNGWRLIQQRVLSQWAAFIFEEI